MTDIHTDIEVHTHVGTEAELEAHVGVEAAIPINVMSTIGKGPQGDAGIVLVPAAEWPPAAPQTGVLYLRGE